MTLNNKINSTVQTSNRLLRLLAPNDLLPLLAQMERVPLQTGVTLSRCETALSHVTFPERGVISEVLSLADGSRMEVGLTGREGMAGLSLLFGEPTAPTEALVQADGTALRLPEQALRTALATVPAFKALLLRYAGTYASQVSQSAACNGRHVLEQRLARWILMMTDRVDSERLVMTQEVIAAMLGVRRPGVTQALGVLQRSGYLTHEKSTLQVLQRDGLERMACECYQSVQRRYAWLMPITS